jgi:erythromycin esterase-like protein
LKIRSAAVPVVNRNAAGSAKDNYKHILEAVGDADIVMIGEASHGTHDFYHQRAEITKLLIEQKNFTFVAVEADWPDAYRVNRFVQNGKRSDKTASDALSDFRRFPMWMWRNTVMLDFVQWLRNRNDAVKEVNKKTAFYGMDLYSFFTSMDSVVEYLEQVSPADAKLARKRYSSFERFQGEASTYGYAVGLGLSKPFEKEVISTLMDIHKKGEQYLTGAGGLIDGDELFYTKQNAEVVKNAEEYYRKMYHADESTWNLRDKHMADCVANLLEFHKQKFPNRNEKVILWAHNSHLGDARATSKGLIRHEWNIGQLMRERYGLSKTFNIGFSTYTGSVTAARNWDTPGNCYRVRNGFYGSYEHILHMVTENWEHKDFSLVFRSNSPSIKADVEMVDALLKQKFERYIGVIYRPDTEKASHYSSGTLPKEWDAVIFMDSTEALVPLDKTAPWQSQYEEIHSIVDTDPAPEIEASVPIPDDVEWRRRTAEMVNDSGVDLLKRNHPGLAILKFDKALNYIDYDIVRHQHLRELKNQILINHADAAFKLKSWNAVSKDCQAVLEADPQNVQAHLLMAEAAKVKGNQKVAQQHFDMAAKLVANDPHKISVGRR